VRMRVSAARLRILRPRIRMRISARGFASWVRSTPVGFFEILVAPFKGVLFGGNANNGANAGLSYSNTNNTASNTNANISSQLCFFPTREDHASRQKITTIETVLVGQPKAPN